MSPVASTRKVFSGLRLGWWGRRERRPYHALIAVMVITLIVIGAQTLLRRDSEWQQVYVAAGKQWLAGYDIYKAGVGYAYPPFMAIVAAPFAAVPEWLSRLTWF